MVVRKERDEHKRYRDGLHQVLLQFSCNHLHHVKWLYLLICVNLFQREAHQPGLDLNNYAIFIHYDYRSVGLGHRMFLVFLA